MKQRVDFKPDFAGVRSDFPKFVGAISTRVSCDSAQGHYFSFYNAIDRANKKMGSAVPSTIGPSDCKCSFVDSSLNHRSRGAEFRYNPVRESNHRILALEQRLRVRHDYGFSTYVSYDGGLAEFILVLQLAQRLPELKFVFNFHWADQWIDLLASTNPIGRVLKRALVEAVNTSPSNLVFTAESEPFGQALSHAFGRNFPVIPIFSAFNCEQTPAWTDRPTDVLFLPQRERELSFCLSVSQLLLADGITVKLGIPRTLFPDFSTLGGDFGTRFTTLLPLPEEEFVSLLCSSKVVILPYDKPYFRWGSSGKFADAIALGCLPLAPTGTALTTQGGVHRRDHEFDMKELRSATRSIRHALQRGLPNLQRTTVGDFCGWIMALQCERSFSSREGKKKPKLALAVSATLWGISLGLRTTNRRNSWFVSHSFSRVTRFVKHLARNLFN